MLARICVVFAAVCAFLSMSAENNETLDLRPKIHGVIRTRWEMETGSGSSRFQVRNARVILDGHVAPAISYFVQTDVCDRGSMKILDAWSRVRIERNVDVQVGQFRMPFGVDPFRGPGSYIFTNRSFIGRQMCNVRAVGAKMSWQLPVIPVKIEGGVFNPTSITDHQSYVKTMAYAAKAVWTAGNVKLTTGIQSIEPDSVRINLVDAAVTWKSGHWTVEGEYMNKHYMHNAHRACNGWLVWADYAMPVSLGVFNSMSVQLRYDGMTDHSNGYRDNTGHLVTDDAGRNRITAGATLAYLSGPAECVIRANYEHNFVSHGVTLSANNANRVLLEMVLKF